MTQAVPLSRQLLELAAEGADLAAAEGRARMVAQAQPLWAALPEGILRDQVLGEVAERAKLPRDDLGQRWGRAANTGSAAKRPTGITATATRQTRFGRPSTRASVRLPQEQAARILLQRCEWWQELSLADHEALVSLPDWHSSLFRWLDRWLSEHEPLPWPGLRAEIAAEPWGARATDLVDGADVPIEPVLDDLRTAVQQSLAAIRTQQAMSVLGRR